MPQVVHLLAVRWSNIVYYWLNVYQHFSKNSYQSTYHRGSRTLNIGYSRPQPSFSLIGSEKAFFSNLLLLFCRSVPVNIWTQTPVNLCPQSMKWTWVLS
jgi:hypothetical protein